MGSGLVVKSNQIIEASYRLTLSEQRLILLCVQQIKRGAVFSKSDTFDISVREFSDAYGISHDRAYSELQKVADRLYERSVIVHNPDPDRPTISATKTRWISSIDYVPSGGYISLTFAQKMIPYIAMLEGGFTRYNLENITGMSSVYGIRFYEFFKCWIYQGNHKKVSLVELKENLELTGKYSSIKDFKLYVLDKAMRDINSNSDLGCSYQSIKTGRRITHIEFSFYLKNKKGRKEKQMELLLDCLPKIINNKFIEKYVSDNPETTRGKTTNDIIDILKSLYPGAKLELVE